MRCRGIGADRGTCCTLELPVLRTDRSPASRATGTRRPRSRPPRRGRRSCTSARRLGEVRHVHGRQHVIVHVGEGLRERPRLLRVRQQVLDRLVDRLLEPTHDVRILVDVGVEPDYHEVRQSVPIAVTGAASTSISVACCSSVTYGSVEKATSIAPLSNAACCSGYVTTV